MIILCGLTPIIMDKIAVSQTKKRFQLTEANEEVWKDTIGSNDLGMNKSMYFYNCTNPQEVVY